MSTQDELPLEPRPFALLGVRPDLLAGLRDLGFERPTPVQEQVIPSLLLGGRDMVGLAQTGTGKTAAFGIPLIQLSDTSSNLVQGLVLCPTRELCVQVRKDIQAMARHVKGLKSVAVYGGASIRDQIVALRRGVQIVVATPGRLLDMLERKAVSLAELHTLVLDEADEMLNMGFRDAIDAVVAQTPETKQTLLFSATMSREVKAIAANYMTNPVSITVGQANAAADNLSHTYYVVPARSRYLALKRLADFHPEIYGLVFCRTRIETQEVADKLIQDGYNADALHGDLSQAQRDLVMDKFRRRNLQLLIATDVAARGLDVNDLSHVINYNLPDDDGVYTHRSGRTGRAGRSGSSVSLISVRESHRIRALERGLKVKFERKSVPTGQQICERQLLKLIETVREVAVDEGQIGPYLAAVNEQLADLDREALIKRFVSLEFNRFLTYYKDAPDLNESPPPPRRDSRQGRDSRGRPERSGGPSRGAARFCCLQLNVGKDDGVTPTRLIGRINQVTGNRDIVIGRISMQGSRTTFETDRRFVDEVRATFEGSNMNGKRVTVSVASGEGRDQGRGASRAPQQRETRGPARGQAKSNRPADRRTTRGGQAGKSARSRS